MIDYEINMQELQHPSKHLTDNYKKDEKSNNFKLLDLSHQEHQQILKNTRLIELWRDVDEAEGFTLDKIGKNVLELRQNRPDADYRKAIKIKIRGALSAGTVEDLNIIAEILFDESFISLTETWHQEEYNFEPAAVSLHLHGFNQDNQIFLRDIAFITRTVMAGGVGFYNRQTFEEDVETYYATGFSHMVRQFIVCDEIPLIDTITDSYAAGASDMLQEFIIVDTTPIVTKREDKGVVAKFELMKGVHIE